MAKLRLPPRLESAPSSQKWAALISIIVLAAVVTINIQPGNLENASNDASGANGANDANSAVASQSLRTALVQPTVQKTQATLCNRQLPKQIFLSQSKEDELLLGWFKNLCGGSYIEMGALDGLRYSNSYVFNKGLDWKGVLIEANPASYQKVLVNRPNELARVHAGVCLDERDLHYIHSSDPAVCGFLEFAAEGFKKRWWTPAMINNALIVRCRRLDKILSETVGTTFHFDFFSLDVEGAELLALQSLNFNEYQFGVILVEADGANGRKDQAIKTILHRAGYTFIGTINRSNWFVNDNFDLIYDDVIYDDKKEG
eukprot:CAMPEP_0198115202 /NCGR_PEP_ID=MMETSP1442-20131203/6376_1 /TAXON_ID= /ORGANISM="Craspedostauros australis, Strain CCMP3328" /LENGTH=314 /DNA_ID=CAMNT_0043772665 /DNA_START=137 /DNA_END=1081 /DNA_ORIENTATION=+